MKEFLIYKESAQNFKNVHIQTIIIYILSVNLRGRVCVCAASASASASPDSQDFPAAHRCLHSWSMTRSSGGSPGISLAVTSHLVTTRLAHMLLWQVSSSLSPLCPVPLPPVKPGNSSPIHTACTHPAEEVAILRTYFNEPNVKTNQKKKRLCIEVRPGNRTLKCAHVIWYLQYLTSAEYY